jgi:hypothetical protein
MSLFEQPSVDPAGVSRWGDEIDVLLRQYFQAEMPDPWPKLTPPEKRSPALAPPRWRGWALFRSRMALAASVALLVGGNMLLSHSFQQQDRARATDSKDSVAAKPTPPGAAAVRPAHTTVAPAR